MKLSMQLSYAGGFKEAAKQVADLEKAGIDVVWVAEAYGFDAPSFMGYLAECGNKSDASLRRAMVYGSVLGSFAVERFGLDRLRHLKRGEIYARARHFAKLTQFKL